MYSVSNRGTLGLTIALGVMLLSDLPAVKSAEPSMPRAIHPASRESVTPTGGMSVAANPPSLLWPVTSGSVVRYTVRLSQDPRFQESGTITAKDQRWAMFTPHEQLAVGTWYWRYDTVRKPGEKTVRSETWMFKIDDSARVFVTPTAREMLAACPSGHPRILSTPDELPKLRAKLKDTKELASLLRSAQRYVDAPILDIAKASPTEKGKDAFEDKNFAKWASKAYGNDVLSRTQLLTRAYLQSGDERIGRKGAEYGLYVARLDPQGVTSRSVSDFADGSCMRAMALAYDTCYDLFTDEERQVMQAGMVARAEPFFNRQMNSLESRVFSAHIWQHILIEATEVAFALAGEVPEADLWAEYVYEVWIARVPLLGGDDGGWANGLNYFGTNFATLTDMPELFERLTGVDFFDHPWYRNTPYYMLYGWPPGSAPDGFGDGSERGLTPSESRGRFVQTLGERFDDPYALWYAEQVTGEKSSEASVEPKPPTDLPQARAFRDTGVVAMHTDLADTPKNLMVAMRSSPFGSFNHMHSDQNSVNIMAGGKRLFAGSGYYIGYGDEHFKNWYTQTKSHNSVLIDGRGQTRGDDGYGWIARYLHGEQITYALGDASQAYGDAGLTRFRRHVVFLRPNIIVIYDDLEADHPATWSWLWHSDTEMTVNGNTLRTKGLTADARVDLYGSVPIDLNVDDRFDPPAANWRNKKSDGETIEYPDQWHATGVNTKKSKAMRFLAIIQLDLHTEHQRIVTPNAERGGRLSVGPWEIHAALPAEDDATLLIQRPDTLVSLEVNRTGFTDNRTTGRGSARLNEGDGRPTQQCQDELPVAAR